MSTDGHTVQAGTCDEAQAGAPRREPVSEPVAAQAFLLSTRHFLPELPQWLKEVKDPRRRLDACTYSMEEVIMLALVMLCCQCGSRRQLDRDSTREQFLLNFRMLLGDGLCANEPVMEICDRYGWSHMATLKDGQLPTLQEQVARAKRNRPVIDGSGRTRLKATCGQAQEHDPETGLTRTVRWITPLRYHRSIVHWIEMEESGPEGTTYHNVWVTNIKPNRANAMALAKAGRLRWKIDYADIPNMRSDGWPLYLQHAVRQIAVAA